MKEKNEHIQEIFLLLFYILNVMLFFSARNNPTKIARISLTVMNEKLVVSSA